MYDSTREDKKLRTRAEVKVVGFDSNGLKDGERREETDFSVACNSSRCVSASAMRVLRVAILAVRWALRGQQKG